MYDRSKVVEAVLKLWDMHMDTDRIARVIHIPQQDAERFLHEGLMQRRREREGQAAYIHDDGRRDS